MGRRVIVTGGFGALGRAVTATLGAAGDAVAAIDVAPAIALPGAAFVKGGVDLAEADAVAAAFAGVAAALGGIDALVNVAGGFVWETVDGGSEASLDAMYRINLRTAVAASRAVLPHLAAGGAIVNVGAAGALKPATGFLAYAASKAGVHALTESLADEVRGRGIRVNAILPTTLDTPTNRADMPDVDPAGWVSPAAAAAVIGFLISDEARAITGAMIPLSLGG